MPIEILMPALSPTMTEGNLATWHIKEGDTVSAGDVIAEIETDKATMEVEAVDEGVVGKIVIPEGTEAVQVNTVIAVLLEDGEDQSALDSYTNVTPQQEASSSPESAEADSRAISDNEGDSPRISASENSGNDEAQNTPHIPSGVIEVLMPALSPTMTEGNLAAWTIKEGDTIEAGQVIAEIETDKATMEVEAVDEGVVGKILVEAGTNNVQVNVPIAALLTDGTDKTVLGEYVPTSLEPAAPAAKAPTTAAPTQAPTTPAAAPAAPTAQATTAPQPPAATAKSGDRVSASPLARRLAHEANIDIASVKGTGPKGRVVKADIEAHVNGTAAVSRDAGEWELHKNSSMRKVIARRLQESKQHVPHFYLSVDCELDALLDVRKQLNAKAAARAGSDAKPAYKLSVNDLVLKATALAMRDVPAANASWYDDATLHYSNVDISVAVAIEGGLVTPVLKNADQKSLPAISNEVKALAAKARDGKLLPEEMQGGGFSVSNLGMFGIKHFSAIINPPQSCILAVGAGKEQMVVKHGTPEVATVMTVTLSVDHRSVDGAVGAQFLQAFCGYIENPVTMLV